jgi:BirA family biotin operon repressor/biotin-[acetyl-CoA-carboxylase] ligase
MELEIKNKLLQLLNDCEFLSYNKITKNLNISRSTISKQIKSLKELGYEIKFVKNKGYHLISEPEKIILEKITTDLNTDIIGKDVFYFRSITSTNFYAKQMAEKGINEGIVVIADIQTQGRGRKNRVWLSPFGGLWFSVILRPNIIPERGMFLTMVASISIAQAIKEITTLDPVIKWPNDLLINGKKVCGILSEFDTKKNIINYAIIGIGINLNNKINGEIKEIATSLSKEFGSDISKIKFLRFILKYFDQNYKKLIIGDFDNIKKLWISYSKIIGKIVKIMDNGKEISGIISDVDENGYLIIKSEDSIYKISDGNIIYL